MIIKEIRTIECVNVIIVNSLDFSFMYKNILNYMINDWNTYDWHEIVTWLKELLLILFTANALYHIIVTVHCQLQIKKLNLMKWHWVCRKLKELILDGISNITDCYYYSIWEDSGYAPNKLLFSQDFVGYPYYCYRFLEVYGDALDILIPYFPKVPKSYTKRLENLKKWI